MPSTVEAIHLPVAAIVRAYAVDGCDLEALGAWLVLMCASQIHGAAGVLGDARGAPLDERGMADISRLNPRTVRAHIPALLGCGLLQADMLGMVRAPLVARLGRRASANRANGRKGGRKVEARRSAANSIAKMTHEVSDISLVAMKLGSGLGLQRPLPMAVQRLPASSILKSEPELSDISGLASNWLATSVSPPAKIVHLAERSANSSAKITPELSDINAEASPLGSGLGSGADAEPFDMSYPLAEEPEWSEIKGLHENPQPANPAGTVFAITQNNTSSSFSSSFFPSPDSFRFNHQLASQPRVDASGGGGASASGGAGKAAPADVVLHPVPEDWERIGARAMDAAGLDPARSLATWGVVREWLSAGATETLIVDTLKARTRPGVHSLSYFREAMREAIERRRRLPPEASAEVKAAAAAWVKARDAWALRGYGGPAPRPQDFGVVVSPGGAAGSVPGSAAAARQ